MTTTIRPILYVLAGIPMAPTSFRNLRSRDISSTARLCPLGRLKRLLCEPTTKANTSFPCGCAWPICPIKSITELQLRFRGSLPATRLSRSSLWSRRIGSFIVRLPCGTRAMLQFPHCTPPPEFTVSIRPDKRKRVYWTKVLANTLVSTRVAKSTYSQQLLRIDCDERSFRPSPDTNVSSTPLSNCFAAITSGLIRWEVHTGRQLVCEGVPMELCNR